ncbi:hypothetical protein [Cohnella sp. GCM10027633]|uniref:hypothetical protein n=1 Tax=unclassified Cohnella TaxID=2636738 RepID=UPI003625D442
MRNPYFAYEKYFSLPGFANYLLFYAVILACAWAAEKTSFAPRRTLSKDSPLPQASDKEAKALFKESVALAVIAFGAQWLWIARMIMNEGVMRLYRLAVVQQDFQTFKLEVVNKAMIPGVTSFTQFGMIAAAMYSIYVFGMGKKGDVRIWLMILLPGVLRGLFFSERLALMEVVIPILVMALVFNRVKLTLPKLILSAMAFVGFFSIAEGLRSYRYYSENGFEQAGVYSYGIGRFLDYITSSVNHSIAMVDLSGQLYAFPALLFNGWINLISMVVPGDALSRFLHTGQAAQAYANIKLSPYSAQDYTNMGYFGQLFADSGYLYLLYAVIYGVILGAAYKGLKRYEIGWLAIYPVLFISVLESYRIAYLFETRTFYPLLYMASSYAIKSVFEWKRGQGDGARKQAHHH